MTDTAVPILGTLVSGRYRVLASIGAGRMGAVYEAEDMSAGTRVAIKILLPEAGKDAEATARFVREAKAMSLLTHPNIVQLVDHGRLEDGACFLVSELVRGVALRAVIDDGVVEQRRALSIVRQILEALGHAHDHGVVHRDVTPDNIMLADGGWPDRDLELIKVLDFGVAKLVEDTLSVLGEAKLTQTGGHVLGAPQYASPEAALGRPVDRRADLYSAGVVLFELLTGKPPFTDPDPTAVLRQHASDRTPALAEAAPDRAFTPQLEYVVAEALAKQPERRFSSASEMIGALDSAFVTLDGALAPLDPAPDPSPRTSETVLGLGPVPGAAAPSAPAPPPPAVGSMVRDEPLPSLPPPPALVVGAVPRYRDPRRTRQIVAIGFALFVIIVAIATRRSGPGKGPLAPPAAATTGPASPGPAGSDLDRRAAELLARGDAAGASDLLDRELQAASSRDNPRAYLVLGHARIALGHRADGLAAYERAIALDRELAGDAQLKQNVIKVLDTRDAVAAVVALELLASRLQPPAREQILAQASNGKVMEVRHRAFAIAARDGFAAGIDQIESWSLDVEQATSCDERRGAVLKLRAAGDRRALIMLRRVRGKFACSDRDVASAISELEARP